MQLTVQLLELNQPIYIGLNMIDVATKHGIKIDYHKLMKKLKTPIFSSCKHVQAKELNIYLAN